MKTYKKVITVTMIILGGFFLLNSVTDIQFGFGSVLLLMGLYTIPDSFSK